MRRLWTVLIVLGLAIGCTASDASQDSPAPPVASPSATPSASPVPAVQAHDYAALDRGVRSLNGDIRIWGSPGGESRMMVANNPMGERMVFLVTQARELATTWYRILLPRRPNGSTAWVKEGPDVRLVKLPDRVEIDLSEYTLVRYEKGKRVARYKVGIGQPQWPTPIGTFYVWAHVPQPSPSGPYGAYAIGLSGFSDVLTDWPGGGRFAIHGTVNRWDAGRKVSHGCIRVFNPQVMKLRDLPLGTPVVITR
ncbi:MAG: L,D-transpeptidase family protein [Actinobacteria bacterium]|nr:L,D-transpeptidase family protein [Actinomycetota bacterium]